MVINIQKHMLMLVLNQAEVKWANKKSTEVEQNM